MPHTDLQKLGTVCMFMSAWPWEENKGLTVMMRMTAQIPSQLAACAGRSLWAAGSGPLTCWRCLQQPGSAHSHSLPGCADPVSMTPARPSHPESGPCLWNARHLAINANRSLDKPHDPFPSKAKCNHAKVSCCDMVYRTPKLPMGPKISAHMLTMPEKP